MRKKIIFTTTAVVFAIMFVFQLSYYQWVLEQRGAPAGQALSLYAYAVSMLIMLVATLYSIVKDRWSTWQYLLPISALGSFISILTPAVRPVSVIMTLSPVVYVVLRQLKLPMKFVNFATYVLTVPVFLWSVDASLDLPPILANTPLLYLAAATGGLAYILSPSQPTPWSSEVPKAVKYVVLSAVVILSLAVLVHTQSVTVSQYGSAYPYAVALVAFSSTFAVMLLVATIYWAMYEEIPVRPYVAGETETRYM